MIAWGLHIRCTVRGACQGLVQATWSRVRVLSSPVRICWAPFARLAASRLVLVVRVVLLVLYAESFGFLHERPLLVFTQQTVKVEFSKQILSTLVRYIQ